MQSAELPCEKKTSLGCKWTTLRPTPASSKKVVSSKVMFLASKDKLYKPTEVYSLSPENLCTVSDIVSFAHTSYDRVLSESEDSLRTSGFKNTLLKALDGDTIERLRLQPIKFELKHEIESPGDPINHLYFLEDGMASMTTTF